MLPDFRAVSLDLCQHIINEMTYLTTFASRIYDRAAYSNNSPILEYLSETLGQVSRDIHQITGTQSSLQPSPNNVIGGSGGGGVGSTVGHNLSKIFTQKHSQTLLPGAQASQTLPQHSSSGNNNAQQEMFQKFLEFMQLNNNSPNRMNGTTVANDDKSQYDN